MRTQIYNKFYTWISQDDKYMREWEVSYAKNMNLFRKSDYITTHPQITKKRNTNWRQFYTAVWIEYFWNVSLVMWWENWAIIVDKSWTTLDYDIDVDDLVASETFWDDVIFIAKNNNWWFDICFNNKIDTLNKVWSFTISNISWKETINYNKYYIAKVSNDYLIVASWKTIYIVHKKDWIYELLTYVYIWEEIKNIFTNNDTIITYTTSRRINFIVDYIPEDWTELNVNKNINYFWNNINEAFNYNWIEYVIYDYRRNIWYFDWTKLVTIRWKQYWIVSKFRKFYNLIWVWPFVFFNVENFVNWNLNYDIWYYWNLIPHFPKWINFIWSGEVNSSDVFFLWYEDEYFYISWIDNDWNEAIFSLNTNWALSVWWEIITQDFDWQTQLEKYLDKTLIEIWIKWVFNESYISLYIDWNISWNEIKLDNNWIKWIINISNSDFWINSFSSIAIKIRFVNPIDKLYSIKIKYEPERE